MRSQVNDHVYEWEGGGGVYASVCRLCRSFFRWKSRTLARVRERVCFRGGVCGRVSVV